MIGDAKEATVAMAFGSEAPPVARAADSIPPGQTSS
jgi:hypothetical protein